MAAMREGEEMRQEPTIASLRDALAEYLDWLLEMEAVAVTPERGLAFGESAIRLQEEMGECGLWDGVAEHELGYGGAEHGNVG